MPNAMTIRKRTVEHMFGTLKHWMGWTHFLMRGIENVGTEMSLSVLAYNFKRVLHPRLCKSQKGNETSGGVRPFPIAATRRIRA